MGEDRRPETNFPNHRRLVMLIPIMQTRISLRLRLRPAAGIGLALIWTVVARAADEPVSASVAEVTQLERELERLYNEPDIARNPSRALVHFDGSAQVRLFDIMQPAQFRGEA